MDELLRDRKKDLGIYGDDPYVNAEIEKQKHLNDLKIYAQTGFKHQFNGFNLGGISPSSGLFQNTTSSIKVKSNSKQEKINSFLKVVQKVAKKNKMNSVYDPELVVKPDNKNTKKDVENAPNSKVNNIENMEMIHEAPNIKISDKFSIKSVSPRRFKHYQLKSDIIKTISQKCKNFSN